MQIERIEVLGFGCLARHVLSFDPGRVNLILAPNEAGKSTLLAAIETALFGFPSARTQEGRELRQCHRPWSGGSSRVVLHLRHENHLYSIEYDILDASGNVIEKFTAYRDHQDVTDEMRGQASCPGEWLFHLSRDDFRRSVLVRQGDLESISRDTDGLVRLLESLATSTEAGASAAAAQERLQAALDDYRVSASLDRWSSSYLAQAKQWPRVEARLQQAIENYEQEKQELQQRRESLAAQITKFEQNKGQGETMSKVHDCLWTLERGIRKRELTDLLDKDEQLKQQIETLSAKLGTYNDVQTFPADREKQLTQLIERETQLRSQLAELEVSHKRCDDQLAEDEQQRSQLASISVLTDRGEQLREQLTLFEQCVNEEKIWRDRHTQAITDLESEGYPIKQLQEARTRYTSLTEAEREQVRNFELNLASMNRQRYDMEKTLADAQRQLEQIVQHRRGRRQAALAILCIALLAGCTSLFWGIGSGAGIVLLVVMLVLLPASVMLILNARQLDAYNHDRLCGEITRARESMQQLDEDEASKRDRLRQIGMNTGSSIDELVEAVKFYLAHHDKLEACDRMESRYREASERACEYQRRWAEWFRDTGQDVSADHVTVEMAEALVQKIDRFKSLTAQRSSLSDRRDELTGRASKIRTAAREVQEQITTLLKEAHVDLELPTQSYALISAEEIIAARRDFERLARRSAERKDLISKRESLRQQLLPEPSRADLQIRIARLDQETRKLTASTGSAIEALAWLQSYGDSDSEQSAFTDWRFDTLVSEDVVRVREQCQSDLDNLRSSQTNTWQQVRGFLKDYVARIKHIDGELQCLKTELGRGQRFAKAVTIASETLRNVQSNSYERWSSLLSSHLKPLLSDFLPDYRLEGIAADLSPVLIHETSGQRLDLERIRLHLSHGAKDRLFLAMRLALAGALGQERGIRLSLLLDDPLANWDDETLAHGIRVLADLGSTGGSLIIFSCQRSRFESFIHSAGDKQLAISIRDFH